MRKRLTELSIEKLAPPTTGRLEVHDDRVLGLSLRITSGGAKSFVVRGRLKGRGNPVRITLGKANMGLTKARLRASDILKMLSTGKDPRTKKQEADDLRFERVVETFMERHASKNKSGSETRGVFQRYVLPKWKNRQLGDIGRADVVSLLDDLEDRISVYAANRTLAAVRKLMNWAVLRGMLSSSPIVVGMAREGEIARTRYLTSDEIKTVWGAAEKLGYPYGRLIQFLLATGQRRGECSNAKWTSFGQDIWTLKPEETKANREHIVPLSDLALEILAKCPKVDRSEFVFTTNGRAPISHGSGLKSALDETTGPMEPWRLHDLRRTMATGLQELGIPPHVIGAVLNHSPKAAMGVTSIYARSNLLAAKRQALNAWGRQLTLILEGKTESNVVRLTG